MEMVQNPYCKLGRLRAPPTLFFHKNNIFVFLEDSCADISSVSFGWWFSYFYWFENLAVFQDSFGPIIPRIFNDSKWKADSRVIALQWCKQKTLDGFTTYCSRVSLVISHRMVCFPNWHRHSSTLIVRSIFFPRAFNSRFSPFFFFLFSFEPRVFQGTALKNHQSDRWIRIARSFQRSTMCF